MNHEDPKRVDLSKLMDWYSSQCNGDWEHHAGLSIETLDNPRWLIKVNLAGTNLAEANMSTISEGQEPSGGETTPWINCRVEDNQFMGACDPTQLPRLISTFNALIDSVKISG